MRVTLELRELLLGAIVGLNPDDVALTYQCHRPGCNTVYAIAARSIQSAA